jgi:CRP-like cAMP-binding protein
MENQQKLRLVDGLMQITLKKDEYIFREGDDGIEFFIIERGEVDCLKESGQD